MVCHQAVWDARAVREFGDVATRLDGIAPYNSVLSIKLCEANKECPRDLVGQVAAPYFGVHCRVFV